MTLLGVILLVFGGLAAAEVLLWCVVGARTVQDLRAAPFMRRSVPGQDASACPPLSVVVPAHNEQRVAAVCARSILASDYPELELIFVLDRCTDGTRASLDPIAAADPRLRIVDNATCPDDWAGKCNAARVGAALAGGQLILFTDADTQFDPQLLRKSVALLQERALQMLSLLSTPTRAHWFERIVQPAAILTLLKLFPVRRANADVNRRAMANGQFLLFERTAYDQLGGHAAVKDDLLEDLGFARLMKKAGMRQNIGVANGMLMVSMYDSWDAFCTGWRRIYIEGCVRNPDRLARQARQILVACAILPTLRTLGMALGAWELLAGQLELQRPALAALCVGAAAWVARTVVVGWISVLSRFSAWGVVLFPFAAYMVVKILLQGARDLRARTPVRWGGRQYLLEPTNH